MRQALGQFADFVTALCRACDPLHRLDANDGRNDRDLEPVIGFAEVFLHGLAIEPAGDLLGGGDGKLVAGDLNEAADFELILEQFAFRLGALQDGIGLAD